MPWSSYLIDPWVCEEAGAAKEVVIAAAAWGAGACADCGIGPGVNVSGTCAWKPKLPPEDPPFPLPPPPLDELLLCPIFRNPALAEARITRNTVDS